MRLRSIAVAQAAATLFALVIISPVLARADGSNDGVPGLRYAGISMMALAGVGYGLSAVFTGIHLDRWNEGGADCHTVTCDRDGQLIADATNWGTAASLSFLASGALLGTGVAMFVGGLGYDQPPPTIAKLPVKSQNCADHTQCLAAQGCEDGRCVPRTALRDPALLYAGIICLSVGSTATIPAAVFSLSSMDITGGGGSGDRQARVPAGVIGGLSLGLIIAGGTMIGVGAASVPIEQGKADRTRVTITPIIGLGFAGLSGRF